MPAYTWDAILQYVARKIGEAADTAVETTELVAPPDAALGDLAYGCFKLAKKAGKKPDEIAKSLEAKFAKGDQTIETAKAAGPYLNITLRTADLITRVVLDVESSGAKFGAHDQGKNQQIMLEYAQPNTHKELHVGHLRNLILGASLARLLQNDGWKVITASYHGDVGAHVAKCLWFLVRQHSSVIAQPKPKKAKKGEMQVELMAPEAWSSYILEHLDAKMAEQILDALPKEQKTGNYLGSLYSESSKVLEENPEWKDEVSKVQQQLEAHAAGWQALWQETRRWSVAEFAEIFQELGVMIDRQYFESEVVAEGQKIVDGLLKKNIAKPSQGAIVVDLEGEKLGVFLVRKSDGTSLYSTKDLALAEFKFKEYPKLERSLMVVDFRQALYFKQLFRTLQLMGVDKPLEFVGYEFLTLKSGAMSSRQGNIVTYESFRDEVVEYARRETAKRHPDWPQGKVDHVAWCLGLGGIKYGMLKQDSEKVIVFDLEKSLSFDGDTGPYIQYAATRLRSILKKANWEAAVGIKDGDLMKLTEKAEKKLALQLGVYPDVCAAAAKGLKPSILAQWCFSAAQAANEFYRDVPVLEAPAQIKAARLQLVAAASSVLMLGLNLLGIPVPDEM